MLILDKRTNNLLNFQNCYCCPRNVSIASFMFILPLGGAVALQTPDIAVKRLCICDNQNMKGKTSKQKNTQSASTYMQTIQCVVLTLFKMGPFLLTCVLQSQSRRGQERVKW